MSTVTLTNCKILLGGYNLSSYHNQLELTYDAEMLDDTVFGTSGTRSSKPGLKTVESNGTIFWDSSIDAVIYNRVGAAREVMSWAMEGEAIGDWSNTTRGVNGTYTPLSGEVGQLISGDFNAMASNTPLVRGRVLIPPGTPLTVTGEAAGVQLGAVVSPQRVYSGLHVTDMTSGSAITVVVESDDNAGFTSPTTRITHSAISESGLRGVGDWKELAGPITDTYWRATWTITGTTPSITAYLTVGIL